MPDTPKKDNTKVEVMLRSLGRDVEELRDSEAWRRMLEVQARFHRYSASNMLLIYLQRPEATQVAGFRQWQKLGRQVRRGERSLKIFAPMTRKDEATGESKLFGFKLVSVFDVAQTDGDPLPVLPWPEAGEVPEGLLDDLAARAGLLGFPVTVGDPNPALPQARGWFDRRLGSIHLVAGAGEGGLCATLLHELGHALDPQLEADDNRARRELVAESVAYVLGVPFGIPLDAEVTHYLASWQGGVDALLAVMDRVKVAVDRFHAVVTSEEVRG